MEKYVWQEGGNAYNYLRKKGISVGMSYFRKTIEEMSGYVPGFQPEQHSEVVKLNTNENPYLPSPAVLKALSDINPRQLRMYPDPLANSFRQAAAELHDVSPENIICSNGADELLNMAFRAFCDSRRPVAYPVPTYSLYPVLAKIQDCRTIEVGFGKNFILPKKLAQTKAALTIVCNPNAPTGSFIEVDKMARLAAELKGVLLIDEAYVDFAEDSCVRLIGEFDNVIIVRSMSKGYSLAGVRFGYAIAQTELIEGLMKVKDSYNVDAAAIAAATAAIKDQGYFKANVEKVKAERSRLTGQLRGLGFDVPASSANFVFARCRECSAGEIYEELVARNIYVRYFGYPGLKDKLRITVGQGPQTDRLISALKEILKK